MLVQKRTIALVGSEAGTGTFYSTVVSGKVLSITYTKDATNPLTSGTADITITTETTEQAILTITDAAATATYAPRQAVIVNTSGSALVYSAGNPVQDYIYMHQERIKVAIAQAGDATKVGTITVILG